MPSSVGEVERKGISAENFWMIFGSEPTTRAPRIEPKIVPMPPTMMTATKVIDSTRPSVPPNSTGDTYRWIAAP